MMAKRHLERLMATVSKEIALQRHNIPCIREKISEQAPVRNLQEADMDASSAETFARGCFMGKKCCFDGLLINRNC